MPETIRKCTPADAEAIAALIGKLSHYFVADAAAASVQPFLATFRPPAIAELLAKPEFVSLAAEEDGRLVGVITLHRPAHLHHLFVSPDTHRRGIARSLWRAIQAEFPVPATVTVNSSEFAVPVYQRLGFVATAEVQERNGVRYVPMCRTPDLAGANE
ncbi:GNAT family N-acetyltransferase [Quatrionicoccus australiensis]|uniref:GNAT family N-acetyltransferase n=1 Tax=Quatrionicoccus australiensis TaxID=138118 RepID=UPI001CFA466A|nr:GNAT family N-acetyltransferase [Quatrionicoccus australiensis]MCB4361806.1 GNAT family N-acetyltransferase [Quatrionicoccus australiensis]